MLSERAQTHSQKQKDKKKKKDARTLIIGKYQEKGIGETGVVMEVMKFTDQRSADT